MKTLNPGTTLMLSLPQNELRSEKAQLKSLDGRIQDTKVGSLLALAPSVCLNVFPERPRVEVEYEYETEPMAKEKVSLSTSW